MAQAVPTLERKTADEIHKLYEAARAAAVKAEKAAQAHAAAVESATRDELRKAAKLRGTVIGSLERDRENLVRILTGRSW